MATKYLDKDGLEYFYNKIKGQIGGGKQSDWNETDTTDLAYINNKPVVNKLISTDDGNGNVTFSYQTLLNAENLVDGSATGSLRNRYSATENSSYTIGQYATALGRNTKASGEESYAEGSFTTASGSGAHVEGFQTVASGTTSHAEGSFTTASALDAHAEGGGTTASGLYAHAEGASEIASGAASHAEGVGTTASGDYSHAEGNGTTASGRHSHTQNLGTKASSDNQTALGKYNIEDSNSTYAVIVGNGTSNSARSNALTVDWSGNVTARVNQDILYDSVVDLSSAVVATLSQSVYNYNFIIFKARVGSWHTFAVMPHDLINTNATMLTVYHSPSYIWSIEIRFRDNTSAQIAQSHVTSAWSSTDKAVTIIGVGKRS